MTTGSKSEQTRLRILNAALDLFRTKGFWETTMREIASAAGMATGAAYYYFPSKDAIVLAFYERAQAEMAPDVDRALDGSRRCAARLEAMIEAKLRYFEPNRKFLGALLGHTADRNNPLSPFGDGTAHMRASDLKTFERLLEGGDLEPPRDLAPHLPGMLWAYQMSIILFWLTDGSEGQSRTRLLLNRSSLLIVRLLKLSSLPLMRPLRKPVIEIVELVRG